MTPRSLYVDPPDIPEGMTVDEYRRRRVRPPRQSRLRRAWRWAARARRAAPQPPS